jgi:hypothetical protein
VIVDIGATRSIRQAEVGAAQTTLDRTEDRFGLKPGYLTADTTYGTAQNLAWLIKAAHCRATYVERIWTPPDCNGFDSLGSMVTTADVYSAS